MKKFLMLMLSAVLLFSLAACGSSGNNAGGSENGSESGNGSATENGGETEQIKLRVAWWGGQPRHDYTQKVIEMYEEQNPHVDIQPEFASWDDYWKKLAPQAAANELPDVLQMDLGYITQYSKKNQLADLNPLIESGALNVDNVSENAINGGVIDGKLYGMNLGVNALGPAVDTAMLSEAGIELKQDWTWEDLEQQALAFTEATGKYFVPRWQPEVFFNYYLRQQGQSLFSADGTLGYEDDQHFVDFFGMLVRLTEAGAMATPDVNAQVKGAEDSLLVKQEAATEWGWSNQYLSVSQVAQRPLDIHPMPGPNQDKGLFLKPSMFFSIAESSEVKEEAAKFISFFINDVEANKLINAERGIPVSSEIKEALQPTLTEEQQNVFEYVAWVEENSSPLDPPDPLGASEVYGLLADLVEQMQYMQLTPEDAAGQFRTQATEILERNQK